MRKRLLFISALIIIFLLFRATLAKHREGRITFKELIHTANLIVTGKILSLSEKGTLLTVNEVVKGKVERGVEIKFTPNLEKEGEVLLFLQRENSAYHLFGYPYGWLEVKGVQVSGEIIEGVELKEVGLENFVSVIEEWMEIEKMGFREKIAHFEKNLSLLPPWQKLFTLDEIAEMKRHRRLQVMVRDLLRNTNEPWEIRRRALEILHQQGMEELKAVCIEVIQENKVPLAVEKILLAELGCVKSRRVSPLLLRSFNSFKVEVRDRILKTLKKIGERDHFFTLLREALRDEEYQEFYLDIPLEKVKKKEE
jgi:hypothetical protein